MKLTRSLVALGLACAATAASAQFAVMVMSDQPIVIGPLIPPQQSVGLNPAGKTVLRTSAQTFAPPVPVTRKIRQPDVMISNQNYKLDCYEQTPGVCDRIALLLEQYGGR